MKEKTPQQLLYTPTIPLGVEGKTLTLIQKRRKSDELHQKKIIMSYIRGSRDLISTGKKTLVENLQSLRANQYGDDQEESLNKADVE